tara:strand:- start:91 stop:1839 length:1749 start_codon:yes stop_codon:yes gene_type:complete
MAITINNTPKVALSGPVGASVSTNAPAAAFGSLQADATLRTGAALEKSLQSVADAYAVRDETDNLRIAKDLEREYVDFSNLLMYGDGTINHVGFMNLKGQLAVDSGADAAATLAEYQAATLAQYEDNTRVTQLYTDSTSTRIDGSNIQIMGHTAVQRNVVTVGASDAFKEMSVNESLADPMNSDLTDRTIAVIGTENGEQAIHSGISAQELATQNQTEQSAYLLSLVTATAADNTNNAMMVLAENVDMMTAVDADKAEAAILAAGDTSYTLAERERIANERNIKDGFDAQFDFYRIQRASNGGDWDQAAALAEVQAGTMRVKDYNTIVAAAAPASAAVKEASAAAASKIIDDMYQNINIDWRNAGLQGDDYARVAAEERIIKAANGSWMIGTEDLVRDVQDSMLPPDMMKFGIADQLTIAKQRRATALLSGYLKQGFSQDDAYAMVVGQYAPSMIDAYINDMKSYPRMPMFEGELPDKTQIDTLPTETLATFANEIAIYNKKIVELSDRGNLVGEDLDMMLDGYDRLLAWHSSLLGAVNARSAFSSLSEAAKAAVEADVAKAAADAAAAQELLNAEPEAGTY